MAKEEDAVISPPTKSSYPAFLKAAISDGRTIGSDATVVSRGDTAWPDRVAPHTRAHCSVPASQHSESAPRLATQCMLHRLAAEQGYASAQSNLGNMYGKGTGVPQDHAEAVRLFWLASDQGNAMAQVNLGMIATAMQATSGHPHSSSDQVAPQCLHPRLVVERTPTLPRMA